MPTAADLFHAIIGHYLGCGWDAERIGAHLEQHPYGISERYLREGRLAREIERSISKYGTAKLPLLADWTSTWKAKGSTARAADPGAGLGRSGAAG